MPTRWGNYSDYSGPANVAASASHVRDPRLDLLATLIPGLFTAKNCLDIGCNAGGVSCQLAIDFQAASVTGVDIDPKLIAQAGKLVALRSSRARPPTKNADRIVDYFPISAVLERGFIEPREVSHLGSMNAWPRVSFHTGDWVTIADPSMLGPYDTILALSVIKWIHLEHLDQGLEDFFRKCSSSLSPGGYLIIELQTWESYVKAVRPNKAPHFSKNMRQLRHRPETSFDGLLAQEGLVLCASTEALPRPIRVYRKQASSTSPQ